MNSKLTWLSLKLHSMGHVTQLQIRLFSISILANVLHLPLFQKEQLYFHAAFEG